MWLLLPALPIAAVAWTVTHEEVFREPRDYCVRQSERNDTLLGRKFFFLFTCEYCFSHYVAALFLWLTHFQLLLHGWRGYLIAWFAVVWVANQYMSVYAHLRLDIRRERVEIKHVEQKVEDREAA